MVVKTAISKLNPQAIISGYRSTGLYPFNPDAVHFERLTATSAKKYDKRAFPTDIMENERSPSDYEITSRCLEEILGHDVIEQYKEAVDQVFINVQELPDIYAFLVWLHLKFLLDGRATQRQLTTTTIDANSLVDNISVMELSSSVVHNNPYVIVI